MSVGRASPGRARCLQPARPNAASNAQEPSRLIVALGLRQSMSVVDKIQDFIYTIPKKDEAR